MANTFQITVPDIGNFDSVEVIDVIVKIGDTIKKKIHSSLSNPIKHPWIFLPHTKVK